MKAASKAGTSKSKVKKSSRSKWQTTGRKLEALELYKNGKSKSEIAREMKLPFSTISNWVKAREKILKHVENSPNCAIYKTSKSRHPILEQVDKLMLTWIEECNQLNHPISLGVVKEKALRIFQKLKNESTESVNVEFTASQG